MPRFCLVAIVSIVACSSGTSTSDCSCPGGQACDARGECRDLCTSNANCNGCDVCSDGFCQAQACACVEPEDCENDDPCMDVSCEDNACVLTANDNPDCDEPSCEELGDCATPECESPADCTTPPLGRVRACATATCDDGVCEYEALSATTVCDTSESCVDGQLSPPRTCGSAGLCPAGTPTSCGIYDCAADGERCLTTCEINADCATGYICRDDACVTRLALDEPCDEDSECQSNICRGSPKLCRNYGVLNDACEHAGHCTPNACLECAGTSCKLGFGCACDMATGNDCASGNCDDEGSGQAYCE